MNKPKNEQREKRMETKRGERSSGNLSLLDKLVDKLENIFTERSTSKNPTHQPLKPPMSFREFENYLDPAGRLIYRQEFLESVYQGGVCSSFRKIIWRHILNIYPPGMTAKSRTRYLKEKSESYYELRAAWQKKYADLPDEILPREISAIINQVRKDVVRTDRSHSFYRGKEDSSNITNLYNLLCTYAFNHPEVSYCQGMCDIASPILVVQDDEAHAYLLFCSIMERLKYNFMNDGRAMSAKFDHVIQLVKHIDPTFYSYMQEHQVDDLLFTYRWLLLELKREFPLNDSMYFMEVMWSTLPSLSSCWLDIPLTSAGTLHRPCNQEYHIFVRFIPLESQDADEFLDLTERTLPDSDSETISIKESFFERVLNPEQRHAEDHEIDLVLSAKKNCPCLHNAEEKHNYSYRNSRLDLIQRSASPLENMSNMSKSIDSGFLSRSVTPNRNSTDAVDYLDDYLGESSDLSSILPPPSRLGYGNPFLMFAVLAMILQHRDTIMGNHMDFNDIMLLFHHSMRKNDVCTILHETRTLYELYVNYNMTSELSKESDDLDQDCSHA